MSRVDLRFLPSALDLTLDRRRNGVQFLGTAAALLVLEGAAGLAGLAGVPLNAGRLMGFPFFYLILMATGILVSLSCRHGLSRESSASFLPLDALPRQLMPAAAGSAVLVLSAGAVVMVVGLILALGRLHPAVLNTLSVLMTPLAVVLAAAVALLAFGLLVFPALVSSSGGDLDAVLSEFGRILRGRLWRVLSHLVVALALAGIWCAMVLGALSLGWAALSALAGSYFPQAFDPLLQGATGHLIRIEKILVTAAATSPALVFLNAASAHVLSTGEPEPFSAHVDEEEETWLQP